MAADNVFILNGAEARLVAIADLGTDILTSTYYIAEDPVIIKGFDSAVHNTPAIVTAEAAVRALHMVYNVAERARAGDTTVIDYAIWKVYTPGPPVTFYGYLVITLIADSTVASLAANTLGSATIAKAVYAGSIQDWLATDDATDYDDTDDLETDVGAAGDKVRFTT